MERVLAAGDFVLVSKLHYGPRTPERPRLPLTEVRVPGLRLPAVRFPGFDRVRRGDVAVFYHPAEPGPVELRTPYVKRVIGLPGDTVVIRRKQVFVNGQRLEPAGHEVIDLAVRLEEGHSPVEAVPAQARVIERTGVFEWRVRASRDEAEVMASHPSVAHVAPAPGAPDGALFPPGSAYSPDDYGPIVVPTVRGAIAITDENWPEVRATLERENRTAQRVADGAYEIDGAITDSVRFEQNYYFVLGDNRDSSADSRRWGFVPEDHVIGKAVMIYFSWDEANNHVRRDRVFRRVR